MSRAALAAANLSPEQAEAAAAAQGANVAGPSGTPSQPQTQSDASGVSGDGDSQVPSGRGIYPSLTQAMTQSTQDTVIATPLEKKGGYRPEVSVRGEMDDEMADTLSRPKAPVFALPPYKPITLPPSAVAGSSTTKKSVGTSPSRAASNSRLPSSTSAPPHTPSVASASLLPIPANSLSTDHQTASLVPPAITTSTADPIVPPVEIQSPAVETPSATPLIVPSAVSTSSTVQQPTVSAPRSLRETSAQASAQTPATIPDASPRVPTVEPTTAEASTILAPANPSPRASAPPPNRFSVPPPPRPRQSSQALSTSSAPKTGNRMNLLNAARDAAANGTSGPSPGRLPSRSRSASVQAPAAPISSNLGGVPALATEASRPHAPVKSVNNPPDITRSDPERPDVSASVSAASRTVVTSPTPTDPATTTIKDTPVSADASRSTFPAQGVAGPSRPTVTRASASRTPARSATPAESIAGAATPLFLEAGSGDETVLTEAGKPASEKRPMTTAEAAQAILDGMTRQRGTSLPAARRIGKRDKKNSGIKISKRVYKDKTAKKTNRKRKGTEDQEGATSVEPENVEPVVKPKRKMPQRGTIVKQLRKRARRKGPGEEGAEDEASDADMYITKIVDKPRGEYQSAGLAGTDQDRRLAQNRDKRKKKEQKLPAFVQADISAFEPGESVGGEIDINALTMADIATNITHGQVSARGVKLSSYAQEDKAERRRQRMQNAWDFWVNGQPARRKARKDKNLDRERRREECRESGGDPDEAVSEDEPDSDEEHFVPPDRFTPPEDPERVARIQPRVFGQTVIHPTNGQGTSGLNRGEDEEGEQGEEGMDGLEGFGGGNDDAEIQLEVVDNPEGMDEDGEEDELAAAGFAVAAGDAEMGNADNDDEEDDEEVNWEDLQQAQYGSHNYLEEREEQRRRDIEDRENRVVYEEDDTLKMVNSTTYSKVQPRGAPWSLADVDTLYSVS